MTAPVPWPQTGKLNVGGVACDYTYRSTSSPTQAFKYVYYDVFFPTLTLGKFKVNLTVPMTHATTPQQAQDAIQAAADAAWNTPPHQVVLPLPF